MGLPGLLKTQCKTPNLIAFFFFFFFSMNNLGARTVVSGTGTWDRR